MARWHSCNVLEAAGNARNLWQFSGAFKLQRHESKLPSEPLPEKVVAKDWQTLFQPKLDVAWVFPGTGPDNYSCLVAWWYGGVLQNLSLLHLPPSAERARLFREQLDQMRWAGELEGWLNAPPRFRLVADGLQAEDWRNLF